MGLGQTLDQAVQAQAAQLVTHAPGGDVCRAMREQNRERLAQILIGEAARDEHEHQHCVEQGLRVGVTEAQRCCALASNLTRALQMLEGVLTQSAVVADLLDLEQSPVSGKADAAQLGQIAQQPSETEVMRVVDGGLGPQGLALLVVLLDA